MVVEIRYTGNGEPYPFYKRTRMPKIPAKNLNSIVFIYPSEEAARNGSPEGGCGFIVAVPSLIHKGHGFQYIVTNHHVVATGEPVIRVNSTNGGVDFIKTHHGDWMFPQSQTDDLAAIPYVQQGSHLTGYCQLDILADESVIHEFGFGAGDDVFSLGRFIDVDHKQRNYPVARFGVVAKMPEIPLLFGNGVYRDSYLVEMRSRTGFSGSPVYIYLPPVANIWDEERKELHKKRRDFNGPWLLGVHYCQLPVTGPDSFSGDQQGSQYGSGMTGIVPAHKLKKFLLEDAEMVKWREVAEENFKKHPPVNLESAAASSESNPFHKEDGVYPLEVCIDILTHRGQVLKTYSNSMEKINAGYRTNCGRAHTSKRRRSSSRLFWCGTIIKQILRISYRLRPANFVRRTIYARKTTVVPSGGSSISSRFHPVVQVNARSVEGSRGVIRKVLGRTVGTQKWITHLHRSILTSLFQKKKDLWPAVELLLKNQWREVRELSGQTRLREAILNQYMECVL